MTISFDKQSAAGLAFPLIPVPVRSSVFRTGINKNKTFFVLVPIRPFDVQDGCIITFAALVPRVGTGRFCFGRPVKKPLGDFGALVKDWEWGKVRLAEVLDKTGLTESTPFTGGLGNCEEGEGKKNYKCGGQK